MKIEFLATVAGITPDPPSSSRLYVETLGLPLSGEDSGYLHTDRIPGVKHFGVWPLSQAAESCFGTREWPGDIPVPQGWLEFDVEDIDEATRELEERGYRVLVSKRREPWGQVVTRVLGPEGLLVGVTITPQFRNQANPAEP